ncbi:hypothetical protein [Xenorhabdus bovienii]|uniref:hypothetical protein n=1 Tax=Xenorhabdus bovienii TaxID=40576 RepID=UPI0004D7E9D4|nr:hypothetical protein [Xenorhabdus bovienii]CDG87887.1 conserved hypothetical protein [Xenorhabdus bovienii str. feltiae France]CDG91789.1 conserved hypothetical protein [Xenorhabdus bovienii str. feltiae Florida]
MNTAIFERLFAQSDDTYQSIMTICENSTPLVTVLTLHLTCESFLEAYICAHLGIEDLFAEKPDNADNVKFRMSFEHKSRFAQRLGLPREAYDAFEQLNQIRNQFAHKLLQSDISDKQLIIITRLINSIPNPKEELNLEEEGVEFYGSENTKPFKFIFRDTTTPKQMKLVIAYFSLIRRTSPLVKN